MRKIRRTCVLLVFPLLAAVLLSLMPTSGHWEEIAKTKCTMVFGLTGWSIFYESASGTGIITCNNGQTSDVTISMKGGGLTAGRYRLRGSGNFTAVYDIADLFGVYGAADAHAGAMSSARAQVLTKGSVSLAVVAKGQGIDLGVGLSAFRIEPLYKANAQEGQPSGSAENKDH